MPRFDGDLIGGNLDDAIRALFSKQGEFKGIKNADATARNDYVKVGLGTEYAAAIHDMHFGGTRDHFAADGRKAAPPPLLASIKMV
jgi:hypothetical protein